MVTSTVGRVPQNTSPKVNERIRRRTEADIQYFGAQGPEMIEQRLQELDREWELERALEAKLGALSLLGMILGRTMGRRWYLLPVVAGGFMVRQAVTGSCPSAGLLRRLGFRTQAEIERERCGLRAMRGDFRNMGPKTGGNGPGVGEVPAGGTTP